MKAYTLIQQLNNFMINSGIREYCSTMCKGDCCHVGNCYAQQTNDFNYCHTHLPCIIYYCTNIEYIIQYINEEDSEKLYKYKAFICDKLYKILPDYNTNIFFTPFSLLDHELIKQSFPELSQDFYKKMSQYMKLAIKKEYNRYDLHKLMSE